MFAAHSKCDKTEIDVTAYNGVAFLKLIVTLGMLFDFVFYGQAGLHKTSVFRKFWQAFNF